jgi:hypothetical protein
MVDLYPNEQYMLKFTNEEIMKYLIEPAELHEDIQINITTYGKRRGCKKNKDNKDRIFGVSFDGKKANLQILFYDHLIAIFVLDEEIMFFDDSIKEFQSESETYHNVVYEGTLRDKSHEEILNLIYDVIIIVKGTKKIQIEETVIEQVGIHYPKCRYVIKITKDNKKKEVIQLENIYFIIN